MPLNSKVIDNQVTISISGRFDFSYYKEFRNAYRDIPKGKGYGYLIDMRKVDYIDSSVLGMLLMLRQHAGEDSSDIVLQCNQGEVKNILKISNFEKLFTIN